MSIINPPMNIITNGSNNDKKTDLFDSISFFINSETFENIFAKLPDLYPLDTSCIKISGKILVLFNENIKSFPSMTSCLVSEILFDKNLLVNILDYSSRAISKLVPDSRSKLIVLENLSTSEFRKKLPTIGIPSIFL